MATDHNPSGRRPHYQRGRRGTDRRGTERRSPPQSAEQVGRPSDQVDVEQIMREIRNRISQRHGIELSTQQIQDLAARRLEAILEPRNINPTLLEQLRKGAAAPPDPLPPGTDTVDSFADDAIYAGSPVVRFFRRLFNPILKLLFNPAPVVGALQAQGRLNRAAAARAAELERRQTEWNALHYQILQRLVTEVSRASIEMQTLGQRVEALAARVDFSDRRVRALESAPPPARGPRPQETAPAPAAASTSTGPSEIANTPNTTGVSAPSADAPRRRRRRRRGRRGAIPGTDSSASPAAASAVVPDDTADLDEGDEEEALEEIPAGEPAAEPVAESVLAELAPAVEPIPPVRPIPEPAAWPSPGPAPEPSPVDVMPEHTAVAPADESAPAAPVHPSDPKTPEH